MFTERMVCIKRNISLFEMHVSGTVLSGVVSVYMSGLLNSQCLLFFFYKSRV